MSFLKSGSTILVTGGAGYIGSWVTRFLLAEGYQVLCLDRLMFGRRSLDGVIDHPAYRLVEGDCRDRAVMAPLVAEADAVIHLAGLVGDPACAVDAQLSWDINVGSTKMIAELARERGIRFLFASSCSVYGVSSEVSSETSQRAPVSIYAENKCEAEDLLLQMVDDRFAPIILRFATIHGLSPRPRFDLVVNLFAGQAAAHRGLTVFGGDQWRPFVHCADVARALVVALDAPREVVDGQVFNIGSDAENYTIAQIAHVVEELIPGTEVRFSDAVDDERNYRVSFEKARSILGYEAGRTINETIAEIRDELGKQGWDITDPVFSNVKTVREQFSVLAPNQSVA